MMEEIDGMVKAADLGRDVQMLSEIRWSMMTPKGETDERKEGFSIGVDEWDVIRF